MRRKERDGIVWLEFDLLQPFGEIQHGVFLRHGGVSKGKFNSLNLSYDFGDRPEHVEENLRRVQTIVDAERLIWSRQVHGNAVGEVDKTTAPNSLECDALMTQQKGVCLMVKHADCQPALFFDPKQRVIAAVHSGWRGSVQNIYAATVAAMQARYGSSPQDILVCIGPSIGPDHAEFTHYHEELPPSFWQYEVFPMHFDFWAISRAQLQACGILPKHIEIASIDTFGNERDYFSHRRGRDPGRHGTVINFQM